MQLKPLLLLTSLLGTGTLASSQQPPSSSSTTTTLTLALPPSQPLLPNPNALPASTRATLTTLGKNRASAPLSTTNTFVFHNVSRGSYLLDVHCPTLFFVPLRVDVTREVDGEGDEDEGKVGGGRVRVRAWETFRGNDWGNKGESVQVVGAGEGVLMEARVTGRKGYFMERSSCKFFDDLIPKDGGREGRDADK